jgi:hypothetical protein
MYGLLFISFSLAKMGYFSQTNIYAQGVKLELGCEQMQGVGEVY